MCSSPCRIFRAVRTSAARSMRASSPMPSTATSTSMRPCGCSTDDARAPALSRRAAGHRARQRERGGHADGAGDRMRGMAAARREVARGDAVGVVAGADDHRLGHRRCSTHRPGPSPGRRRRRSASRRSQQRSVRRRARRASRVPLSAEVAGAHDHQRHGRVDAGDLRRRRSSRCAGRSGNSEPVTAPQASRKFRRIGAAVPATPSMRVSPS